MMDDVRDKGLIIRILIAAVTVALCIFFVFFLNDHKDKSPEQITEKIVKQVNDVDTSDQEKNDVINGINVPPKNLDWNALAGQNPDIYAWVCVPDAGVDYPVVQHNSDDAYYLDHNIDGSEGLPGTIYTEPSYTSKNFDDHNTVIYGHNMKNGAMFAGLHAFESADSFSGDHYIFIYTPSEVFVYRIFAAYEYSSIHLLANSDMSNIYNYEAYIKDIFDYFQFTDRVCEYRDDIEVTKEDLMITLSTCTNPSNDNYRYLVQGVLLGSKKVSE